MKKSKRTKKLISIISLILITSIFVGYTHKVGKIEFPGGAYILRNGYVNSVNYNNFYYVEDGQVYFTMYDEVQNITEFCSSETYFVDQVQIGNWRQTVFIGGDVNVEGPDGINLASEFGCISWMNQEPNKPYNKDDEINGDIIVGTAGYELRSFFFYRDTPPAWLQNAAQDYDIGFELNDIHFDLQDYEEYKKLNNLV